ncbi:hypothetical protein L228DRAFT_284537 [Xylona heveae TC161]|uniref:Chromo domain-containing protein n=1 Tax=Xylona heveae (strain CBS 132557 / TC161) TaxID=1328760 RepID=A0A165AJG3_XYLHT|nr:hypothetical protein L228DRAFT_284537 [Xylona heveae TC161]KZF20579.1 hypothetical protein L228DRAFT_284537 [Xylona heveae TC161]
MASPEDHIMAEASEDDSISITSTAASEVLDEYEVETILTERRGQDDKPYFLVKWAGYDVERATWEGEESFTTSDMIDDWRSHLNLIERGLEEPFDLDQWELDVQTKDDEQQKRKRRRRAKRRRLGIPVKEPEDAKLMGVEELGTESEEDTDKDSMIEELLQENDDILGSTQRRRLVRGRKRHEKSSDEEREAPARAAKQLRQEKKQPVSGNRILPGETAVTPTITSRSSNIPSRLPTQGQDSGSSRSRPRPAANRIVGRGPSRLGASSTKYQPMLAKRVQGADIFKNWSIPKAKKNRAAGPNGRFTTLQSARWAELRGRNEPVPDANALQLFDPRSAKDKSRAYQSIEPTTTAESRSPWELLQEQLAKDRALSEAKNAPKKKRVSFADALSKDSSDQLGEESLQQSAGRRLSERPTFSQEDSIVPPSTEVFSTGHRWSGGLPHSPTASDASVPAPAPPSRPKKSMSFKEYSEAHRRPSAEMQAGSNMEEAIKPSLGPADSTVDDKDPVAHTELQPTPKPKPRPFDPLAVFAEFKKGDDGSAIGVVELVGMSEEMRKWWLLTFGPKPEVWFREICLADNYREFMNEGKSTFDSVDVLPVGESAAAGIESFEEMLCLTASGAMFFHDSIVIVAYPLQMMDSWSFLNSGPRKAPEAKIRLHFRSPMPAPIRNTQDMNSLSSSSVDVPRLVSVFSDLLKVKYDDLLPRPLKKGEYVEKFFLIFTEHAKEEMLLVVDFLMSKPHDARVYTSTTPGAWDYFSSTVKQGVILIHPSFYRYHLIPRLTSVLRNNIRVWCLGTDEWKPSAPFVCYELFPLGAVIYLTEDLLQQRSSDANAIVQWYCKYSARKVPGTWKLALRGEIQEFLKNEVELKGPYEGRLEMWNAVEGLLDPWFLPNYYGFMEELDPPVIDLGTPEGDSSEAKADYLAEYFAGWACIHAEHFRRFIIVHPTSVESWKERWNHVEVLTPGEFTDSYMKRQ